jgi:hypothetical protein
VAFAGVNYWAVVVAAIAGYAAGAIWYMSLSKPWMEAHGFTHESLQSHRSPVPFILAFLANLVMAFILAGVVGHLGVGQVTLRNTVISAFLLWFGFVLTTLTVNYSFGRRPLKLMAIDGGHWLLVLMVQGVIIGLWGVST